VISSFAQHLASRLPRVLRPRTLLIATAAIALYSLAGFLLTPYLLKRQLTQFVGDSLQRQLTIEEIRFNPYTLRMEVDELGLREGNGAALLGFDRLVVDFDLSSLWERAWTFAEISLEKPELTLAIDAQGETNLGRLIDDLPAGAGPAPDASEAPPARLLVHQLHIGEGSVHLVDSSEPTPAEATLAPLDLEVEGLTTIPQREGPLELMAQLPGGGSLEWRGEVSLSPLASHGQIVIAGLKPVNAWRFFQERLLTEGPGGSLSLDTGYRFARHQGRVQLILEGLRGQLTEFALTPRGGTNPVISLDSFAFEDGNFDLAERHLSVAAASLADGQVLLQFDRQGVLDWQQMVTPSEPEPNSPQAAPNEEQTPAGPPWHVNLDKVLVTGVAIQGTDLSRKVPVNLSLGDLDLSMRLLSEVASDRVQTVVDGFAATISGIQIAQHEDRKTLASLAEIRLQGGKIDVNERRIALDELSLTGGDLAVWRDPEGQINWVQQALDRGVVRGDVSEANLRATSEGRPWSVTVNAIRIADTSASFADLALSDSEVLGLSDITLDLTDVSLDPQQAIGFDLSLQMRQGGSVSAEGSVHASEPRVDASIEVKQLALATAQPYLQNLAHMQLTSGQLSGGGEVHYGTQGPGSLKFAGDIDISGLKILEPQTGKTLIGWEGLKTKGMELGLTPNGLTLEEVVVSHPEGTFVIDEKRNTNWQYVLKDQSGNARTEATSATGSAAFPVSIAHIRIEDGALNFADLSLTPQFATDIHGLNGSIAGLSTAPGAKASIELKGRVDEYGEAKIDGELEPSHPTATTDIHMTFRNVEMTDLTPYTVKFAGYEVNSGKLSLDLGYKIQQHRLAGTNQIVIKHLDLGKKIDSPDALDLPLELGLALLKDSSGKIDINLPVQGDMSNPQFSFGQLIGQAVANFFGKLVTAPFRILGGILGTEAQGLDQIAFEPGRSELPPPEREKLALVAKALRERPELAVSIQGTYDSQRDGKALKEQEIRRVVAEARGSGGKPGEDPGPVSYNDPKSQQALEQVFSERFSPAALTQLKERFSATAPPATTQRGRPAAQPSAEPAAADASGLYKSIYDELVRTAVVTHKELRSIGAARAESVQRELAGADGIAAQRARLVDPAKAERSSAKAVGVITRLDLTVAK